MVIHDDTLERTSGAPVKVADLTRAQLRQMDVGGGRGVPTLAEVLDQTTIPVVVEIKRVEVVGALVKLLRQRPDLQKRVVPISFFHQAVQRLVQEVPGLDGGVLLVGVPIHLDRVVQDAGVRMISLEHRLVTPDLVENLHAKNLIVTVWTPNTSEDIARCLALGVDGIASDYPDLVLRQVGRL
jgi:glycerophosphoryl diester phosphodiesterase